MTILVVHGYVKLKKNQAMLITNYASNNGKPTIRVNKSGINPALLARDYKGFSNYDCSAVLVLEKENATR